MPGTNSARRFKKEKRRRMNVEAIIEKVQEVLQHHGYDATDPEEIPRLVHQMAQGNGAPATTGIARPRRITAVQIELAEPDDMDFAPPTRVVEARSVPSGARPISAPSQRLIEPHLPDDIMETYQKGQERLLNRVETSGVHYRDNGNPEVEGRTFTVHPESPALDHQSNNIPGPPPDNDESLFGDPDGDDFEETFGSGNEKANPHTGLTPSQARETLEQVLGRQIPAPIMGGKNTLKE